VTLAQFVTEVGSQLSALPEDQRPGQVICLIMTDGMENSSAQWTWDSVRNLIEQQRDQWNWKFMFLGANIDAIEVGAQMGFAMAESITYDSTSYAGTTAVAGAASSFIRSARVHAVPAAAFSDENRIAAMGWGRR
jgi:hypothetical protein